MTPRNQSPDYLAAMVTEQRGEISRLRAAARTANVIWVETEHENTQLRLERDSAHSRNVDLAIQAAKRDIEVQRLRQTIHEMSQWLSNFPLRRGAKEAMAIA